MTHTHKFSAVIFDLDGTLLDTIGDIAFATNNVLERNNLPTHPVDDYRFFIGSGIVELVHRTLPESMRTPEFVNEYTDAVRKEYAKCMDTQTHPYQGIEKVLGSLNRQGIPVAVLSNKPHQFMQDTMNTHFSEYNFEVVFGARNGVPNKPDPQSALEIADILGVSPQEIIYVGDTDVDMQTAKAAGFYAVGAAWGFRSKDELWDNGADCVIDDPQDVLNLF